MRKPLANISITMVIVVAFLLMISVSPTANAKRRGTDAQSAGGTTTNYVFMAAGLAVIAGVTVYIVTKGKDDTQQDESEDDLDESESLEDRTPIYGEFSNGRESAVDLKSVEKPAVSPFIGLSQEETITVGVSFSF